MVGAPLEEVVEGDAAEVEVEFSADTRARNDRKVAIKRCIVHGWCLEDAIVVERIYEGRSEEAFGGG